MASRIHPVEHLDADQEIWFISDLHLGDGTPSDAFFGKDRHLQALVEEVDARGATLVIGGDAMDFHQAWSFTRILRAHQELLASMSKLAREGRVVYVIGNHDYDITLYRELLNFRVCDELHIGDKVLVQHGYQYDPFLQHALDGTHLPTKIHHLVERYLDTWIRIPLGEFYTLPNRFVFWLTHKLALMAFAFAWVMRGLGLKASAEGTERTLDFWARSNMGDPMCIFRPIMERLETDSWQAILCGHSHLPGIVREGGKMYANTGSWTFASSQYIVWKDGDLRCHDWITGREFGDQLYAPLRDGSIDEKNFWQWWRENYMGLLRFREGEERRGRFRGWESYIRDHQEFGSIPEMKRSPLEPLFVASGISSTEQLPPTEAQEPRPAEAPPSPS